MLISLQVKLLLVFLLMEDHGFLVVPQTTVIFKDHLILIQREMKRITLILVQKDIALPGNIKIFVKQL